MWKITCMLGLLVAPISIGLSTQSRAKIESKLLSRLQAKETANVFVSFVSGTSTILNAVNRHHFSQRDLRLTFLHSSLVENAERSQRGVLNLLKSQPGVQFQSFWITNQVYVKHVSIQLIQAIAEDPQVAFVAEEKFGIIVKPVGGFVSVNVQQSDKWGIVKIQAQEAWAQANGTGIIVSAIDTGVRGSHETLRNNFVGDYGWFDPGEGTLSPTDDDGHGTHVTGTMAGSNGIGVAPGAKWAHCRISCIYDHCMQSQFVACGQFIACPTLANGTASDCSKAPHVVSNSWGYYEGDSDGEWFDDVIAAWHAAGIVPVFANGNGGPGCSTTAYPANQNVIAVGATEMNDGIAGFSSRGASSGGVIKPDISAPGRDILSASYRSDDGYALSSGTSMACPHVAGVVALIQSSDKMHNLSYEGIKKRLTGNTDKALTFSGLVCNNIRDDVFPNNVFGHGRVNALRSVQSI